MIEVNLHPTGGRSRRRGRRGARRLPAVPGWMKRTRSPAGGRDRWATAAIVSAAIAVLAIGGLWWTQRSRSRGLDARLTEAVEDSTRLADLRALSDSLLARERAVRQRLELVRTLDEGRFVWPHLMDEVSRALPEYTWLTAMRVSTPMPQLAVQLDGLAANPLAITRFVRNLQASPYIGEVRILGSQQQLVQDVAAQAFKLVVRYAPPPDSLVARRPVAEGAL